MTPVPLADLGLKIFADGANKAAMLELASHPLIAGMTTNPTLMRQAGLTDYEGFARSVLAEVREKPISFEVFSDEFSEMRRQAIKISRWQDNVYVKIPITNTRGESALPLVRNLAAEGVKLNITAMLTLAQVEGVAQSIRADVPAIVSVFAGRIADTGRDPVPLMREARQVLAGFPQAELLWASVREVLNIYHAANAGAQIVTVTHDILAKALRMWGQDLTELSLETVTMFARDAEAAGFEL